MSPVIDMTTTRNRTAVRWRAHGTFAGPGLFQGFEPNGAGLEIEGCDVLTLREGKIAAKRSYRKGRV